VTSTLPIGDFSRATRTSASGKTSAGALAHRVGYLKRLQCR